MRKIQVANFGPPDVMALVDVEMQSPGSGQVRVRVHAAGVNPADAYIRAGSYAFYRPPLPYTPGFDAAGVVHEVGSGVDHLKVGSRVFVAGIFAQQSGAYAEYIVCDATAVHPLPDRLSYEQGAAIGIPCVTAYRALIQRGGAMEGETVLIHGASGGVGIPAVQLASSIGLRVIGTAGTLGGQDLVIQNGAHYVLDHTEQGYLDEIASITNGRGVDLVIEMAAEKNLEKDLSIVAKYGRIVVVGSRGPIEITPRHTMIHEVDIRGTALWNMPAVESTHATRAMAQHLVSGDIVPIVGHKFDLADASRAHDFVFTGHSQGKTVLNCA